MDKKSALIWGGIILLLGGLSAAVYFYIKKKNDEEAERQAEAERRAAEAERQAAEAAALAAANQALIDQQTASLNALLPDEANISFLDGQANAAGAAAGGGGQIQAIDANSTGGQQLIAQAASVIASNAATMRTVKNRAGVENKIFAGVAISQSNKISQAVQRQTQWTGQNNDFPVPNRYTKINEYNELIAASQSLAGAAALFSPNRMRGTSITVNGKTPRELFTLPLLKYSAVTNSGALPNLDPTMDFNGNGWNSQSALAAIRFLQNWAQIAVDTDQQLRALATEMLLDEGRIYFPA